MSPTPEANAVLAIVTYDLLDALKAIATNSDEENEWDAVEKLHMNAVTANLAIAKALIDLAKAEGR